MTLRCAPVVVLVVVALLGLAACGGSSAAPTGPVPAFGEPDVQFLEALLAADRRAIRAASAAEGHFEHKEALGLLEAVLDDRRFQTAEALRVLSLIGAPQRREPTSPEVDPSLPTVSAGSGSPALQRFLSELIALDQEMLLRANAEMADGVLPEARSLAESLLATRDSELQTARRLLADS